MTDTILISRLKKDFPIDDLDNAAWTHAEDVLINKYWSGEIAPVERRFRTKILWSETAIYVRFEANQGEPLIISETPNTESKTHGLWERDVCEIFLAPDAADFRRYFEFEIAPNGEWIDLGIHQKVDERLTDWNYHSQMKSFSQIESEKVIMSLKIPLKAFGQAPIAGKVWKGNIFRCVGTGKTRGYLAWQPTFTEQPSFHVPEKFGNFVFSE